MRAVVVGSLILLGARRAEAHDPESPDAHRSMPNQVTAGVTPMCAAHYNGRHPQIGAGPRGEMSIAGVPCIGASISFAREIGRYFEVRLRVSYDKPFPENDALEGGLHELYVTVGPALVAYRMNDALTVTLGPEIGLYGAFFTGAELERTTIEPFRAPGFATAITAAVRPWLTYHTGFFGEVSAGAAAGFADDIQLRAGWLGRVTIGWADRF